MECRTDKYWVTQFNHLDEVRGELSLPQKVEIHDATLREGNQTAGCVMRREELFALAKDLDNLGVNFLEFFPAVSKDDEEVLTQLCKPGALKNAVPTALVRPNTIDLDLALKCGAKHIFLEGPGQMHIGKIMKFTSEEHLISSFVDTAKRAKEYGMTITACPWDCGKASLDFLERMVKGLAEVGVDDITYGDTYGYSMPWTVMHMVRKYREWAGPEPILSCHFHNDYGMATAATLAAVAGGASRVQVAMNNLGERAGNASLDEVAVNLMLNMGVQTDINLEQLYPLSKRIAEITKVPVGAKKAFTGDKIFEIGSGIVADMLEKLGKENCEFAALPYDPSLVGQPPYSIVYGKGCGSKMIAKLLRELGLEASKEQITEIVSAIKEESLLTKSLVSELRVRELIDEVLSK